MIWKECRSDVALLASKHLNTSSLRQQLEACHDLPFSLAKVSQGRTITSPYTLQRPVRPSNNLFKPSRTESGGISLSHSFRQLLMEILRERGFLPPRSLKRLSNRARRDGIASQNVGCHTAEHQSTYAASLHPGKDTHSGRDAELTEGNMDSRSRYQ